MHTMYTRALHEAIAAAREAADLIRADFHRPGGPRGSGSKAKVDTEAELVIRRRFAEAFPEWGFLGEETGGTPGDPMWIVDPNDGTEGFLKGDRAHCVAIALVAQGVPVLGVVLAPNYPDGDGDLLAWAEGCGPVLRNGVPLPTPEWPARLTAEHVILISPHADHKVAANLEWVAPARFRGLASLAYRLALTAAGEAEVGASIIGPASWDFAAGHALLRGVGSDLWDSSGERVRYDRGGRSNPGSCFGGAPALCQEMARRDSYPVLVSDPDFERPVKLLRGEALADPARLRRVQGLLLGQLAGDSLGGLVEFQRPPFDVPRRLRDGGTWGILAGQPTDDSEMALALAHSLLDRGGFEADPVREAYVQWRESGPFDIGGTTSRGLGGHPDPASQANGSLMRCSPLGLLGDPGAAAQDARLTHPHPACVDACTAFVAALAAAVDGASVPEVLAAARAHAGSVAAWLDGPPEDYLHHQGWVRIAFGNAFHQLTSGRTLEEALVDTVARGGDTDTNAAIAGALLGAVQGREAVPAQWRKALLSCRPHPAFRASSKPRPRRYWPVDALALAERLALLGVPATAP